MANNETKDNLIKTAINLFSEKGFDGVSVRDIAGAIDVNVSAINYHFKNKENLFKECLFVCYSKLSCEMKSIVDTNQDQDIDHIALKMFNYFVEQSQMFKASFRIFLINSDLFPERFGTEDDEIGPPGGKILYQVLEKRYPNSSEADLLWAVRIIFSLIMHKSLIFTSNCIKANKKLLRSSRKDFESDIKRTVNLVIKDIK